MIATAIGVGDLDVPEDVHAAVDLQGAEAERGRAAEQRREDGEAVDAAADRAVDAVADQRPERGADQVPLAAAVDEVGEREPDHGVDRPRVEGPVEVGVLHGHPRGLRRVGRSDVVGRRGEVRDRLDTPKNMRPMPMPALNIIAIHDEVRNSGLSSSAPSRILPCRLMPQVDREREEPQRREHERPAEVLDHPAQRVRAGRRGASPCRARPTGQTPRTAPPRCRRPTGPPAGAQTSARPSATASPGDRYARQIYQIFTSPADGSGRFGARSRARGKP